MAKCELNSVGFGGRNHGAAMESLSKQQLLQKCVAAPFVQCRIKQHESRIMYERENCRVLSRRFSLALPLSLLIAPAGTSATEASPRDQGNSFLRSLGIGDPDIYYPSFFEGLWNCYSTLIDVETPQGEEKADKKSIDSARKQLGYTVTYQARFVPFKGNIIGDRLFTTTSLIEATVGKNVIEQTSWDPEHANRFSLVLSGGLKVENLVTKRSFEMSAPGQFDTSEYSKQVFDRGDQPGPPSVKASRNLTRYKWDPDESTVSAMQVFQRVSMYKVPGEKLEDMEFSSILNKPITVYKYVVDFKRVSVAI